jgi:hypothetical protein
MANRKLFKDQPQIPDTVRDETATVPLGETGYWLLLTDAEVELLSTGLCPHDVAKKAWDMLGWKREHARNTARELAEAV